MRVIYAPLGVPLYVIVQCAVCHIVRHVVQDVVGLPLLRLPLCRVTTVSGYHIVGHTACCIVHNKRSFLGRRKRTTVMLHKKSHKKRLTYFSHFLHFVQTTSHTNDPDYSDKSR